MIGVDINRAYRSVRLEVPLFEPPSPSPETPCPKPQTPDLKPNTPHPTPQNQNPKPQTPNPKPQTPNPKPQTPNPQPQTPNPQPQTMHQANFRYGEPLKAHSEEFASAPGTASPEAPNTKHRTRNTNHETRIPDRVWPTCPTVPNYMLKLLPQMPGYRGTSLIRNSLLP